MTFLLRRLYYYRQRLMLTRIAIWAGRKGFHLYRQQLALLVPDAEWAWLPVIPGQNQPEAMALVRKKR